MPRLASSNYVRSSGTSFDWSSIHMCSPSKPCERHKERERGHTIGNIAYGRAIDRYRQQERIYTTRMALEKSRWDKVVRPSNVSLIIDY